MMAALVGLLGEALAQEASSDPRTYLREGVNREDLDAEGQRTYDPVVNATTPYSRGLSRPIGMWMHSPRMARHILPLYMYLRFGGDSWDGDQFDVRLTELAILVAAREIDSQYQWTSHEPTALKVGLEQEVIDVVKYRGGLEDQVHGLGAKEALIIRFGRELFGGRRVSSETFARALDVFGRQGVTDLAGLLAFYEFLMLSSNATFDLLMPPDSQPLLPVPQEPFSSGALIRARSVTESDARSAARLPLVNREDLDEDGQRTYDAIVNPSTPYSSGMPMPAGLWLHSPKMAQHALPAYMYLRYGNQLGPRLTELAILVTAREINSQYQWASHEPSALKEGLGQEIIDVVKHRRNLEGLGEEEALIIRFGRELFADRRLSSETFTRAFNAFGVETVTDLAALMAFYEFMHFSLNATFDLQMPAEWQPLFPMP
jgi:4-carboxymuconolactone decarboxylase